jgi:uncharacterized protein YdaT
MGILSFVTKTLGDSKRRGQDLIETASAHMKTIGCEEGVCYVCNGKNYVRYDVSNQIETFATDIRDQNPDIDPERTACLKLYVTGCNAQEHQVLSTIDDSITLSELRSNTNFISRICLKYKAAHIRIDLYVNESDEIRDFAYEIESTQSQAEQNKIDTKKALDRAETKKANAKRFNQVQKNQNNRNRVG